MPKSPVLFNELPQSVSGYQVVRSPDIYALLHTRFPRQGQLLVLGHLECNPQTDLLVSPDTGVRSFELFGLAASILLLGCAASMGQARASLRGLWCRIGISRRLSRSPPSSS